MKRLLLALFASAISMGSVIANDSELFSYDMDRVQQAVSDMSQIEQMIIQNPELSVDDLKAQGKLDDSFDAVSNSPFSLFGEPPLGIPSFLWGCLFWVAGLVVVYVVTEDRDETTKALWGCVASTVFWVVFPWILGPMFW